MTEGGGASPQTLTSGFTFYNRPRLVETLPRAIRYFPMNYISELEMKGQQGEQIRLFVLLWALRAVGKLHNYIRMIFSSINLNKLFSS